MKVFIKAAAAKMPCNQNAVVLIIETCEKILVELCGTGERVTIQPSDILGVEIEGKWTPDYRLEMSLNFPESGIGNFRSLSVSFSGDGKGMTSAEERREQGRARSIRQTFKHPELLDGEVFIGNHPEDSFTMMLTGARRGKVAYDPDGKSISTHGSPLKWNIKPYFMAREKIEAVRAGLDAESLAFKSLGIILNNPTE